ncbi:MAG: IPT/TIG domain-containing protein [Candidatus Dormibacteraeota bacterium]|nr:IPT/TIG domain-containing protein [Candidatus Dormibacteraeota bacterium]MBV9524471.1 IPT/TIG domain-containing protein [Candidatus Dormibacteraeota bacterium]
MNMRPIRSLFVATVVSVLAFSAAGTTAAPASTQTQAAAQAPASQTVATVRPNPRSSVDCNGYSNQYPPVDPSMRMYCADPKALYTSSYGGYGHSAAPGRFYDNGHYVGHDEPSVKFESNATGSGNYQTYFLQLPHDPAGTPTTSPSASPTTSDTAELTPAFWFGLPLCDDKSFPSAAGVAADGVGGYHGCTPDSDSNAPNASSPGGGSAVLELQFFPPGYGPHFDGISCDATRYCAALTIDSLEAVCGGQPHCTTNANCAEPVNFAFLTLDGTPTGPPSPQLNSYETFSPNADTLMMGQSDALRVTILDTSQGLETKVDDLTTGRSGFMIASAANGFMQTDPSTCNGNAYSFHPEYNTAAQGNLVPWSALEFGVLTSFETGHFEPCNSTANNLPYTATFSPSPDTFADNGTNQTCSGTFETQAGGGGGTEFCDTSVNPPSCGGNTEGNTACGGAQHCESSDYPCFNAGSRTVTVNGVNQSWSWPVDGCLANVFQNGDLDFDGSSYIADWPDGGATHPTTAMILGPFDANGATYPQLQFETNVPGSEQSCDFSNGNGCNVPPGTAAFYPYWSIENSAAFPGSQANGACIWNFGNDAITGMTGWDFGKDNQYTNISTFFPGTRISPIMNNPATSNSGCQAAESVANAAPPVPVVSSVSPGSGLDTSPNTITISGSNFSGTFNGSPFTVHSVNVGATQITSTCGAAPCFTVNSATSITLMLPPFTAGTYDVTVTNPGGTSLTGPSDQYVSKPFNTMYLLDAYGGVHSVPPSPIGFSAPQKWPGFQITRGLALWQQGPAGIFLDGYGGLYPIGNLPSNAVSGGPYWSGWDIARGVALLPDASGGFVLDGYGGLHGFALGNHTPPTATVTLYRAGWDIARGVVMRPDGTGGYVIDAFGGLWPFGVNAHAPAPNVTLTFYAANWYVERGVALDADGLGGYTLDAFGGLHPFGTTNSTMPPGIPNAPYWHGWDIARAIALHPGENGVGWTLDAWGGIHEWGGAAPVNTPFFTFGQYINRFLVAG